MAASAAAESKEEWQIQCEEFKQQGDESFRSKDFKLAIQHYSAAIEIDPENIVLYSNRSAAYLANSDKSNALYDAQKCINLNPTFVKGYTRYAAALSSLGRYKDALSQYNHALTLEPDNDVALQGVKSVAELERKKQQAAIDHDRELAQAALLRHKQRKEVNDQQEEMKNKPEEEEEEEKLDLNEDEDDMLSAFFDQVEKATAKTTNESTASTHDIVTDNSSSKLKIVLSDLGTSKDQIDRLLQSNYEWRNLNPYYVLGISDPRNTDMETVQRRFKALSLLVHPDKCLGDMQQRARDAFEEVNKAMKVLLDEDKRNHILGLIDVGKKNARREWEGKVKKEQQITTYEELEEKALMKLFAEVEMKRRDVERRKREYEKRERMQEDEELKKQQNERDFDKNWRKTERVEQRVGNWREFHEKKLDTKKAKITKL